MRETKFIEQNKDKWKEFEGTLKSSYKDPDKLNDLFIQITDDLSYSRTFYPNRSVRVYLNGLAQQIFFSIYKNRKSQRNRIISFWTDELPQLIHEAQPEFRLAFLIFIGAFLIGALSCAMDPELASIIFGDSYVEMTLQNIESGDPMAVYKQRGEFGMTLGITGNNLYVAFLTFVSGALFTIGSIIFLIRNAVMVGAFQYFFIEQNLFWESFLTIWIHGTLEISAIIIAGMAGITMGKGLVFPGTLTRMQSFQRSARRGLKIMIGIVPIIILAGFFEGYLTRHTELPNIVRGIFILLCLAFVLGYFVWYPRYKAAKGFLTTIKDSKLPPSRDNRIELDKTKSIGELFSDIFTLYRAHFRPIGVAALVGAVVYTVIISLLAGQSIAVAFYFPIGLLGTLSVISQFFVNEYIALLPLVVIALFTSFSFVVYQLVQQEADEALPSGKRLFSFLNILIVMTVLYGVIWTNAWYTLFFLIPLTFPFLLLWGYISKVEAGNVVQHLVRSVNLISTGFGTSLGLFLILLLLSALFFTLLDTLLSFFYLEVLSWIFNFEQDKLDVITVIALTFIAMLGILLILVIFLLGFGVLYYSLREIAEATSLSKSIQTVGTTKHIRGLERET